MARVLLADDEPAFRVSLAARLRLRAYEVVEAADGTEALRVLRENAGIDVVILDRNMPGIKGEKLLGEIKRLRPCAAIILLSGYGGDPVPGAWSSHQKPCELEELTRAIESACHAAHRPGTDGE